MNFFKKIYYKIKAPTYDEILKMSSVDNNFWTIKRALEDRDSLLLEMIAHEKKFKSAENSITNLTEGTKLTLALFDIKTSLDTIYFYKKIEDLSYIEGQKKSDFVLEAILAKTATDYTNNSNK